MESDGTGTKNMGNEEQAAAMQLLGGYALSFIIKTAMEIGLFRALDEGIHELDMICENLALNPAALRQLMRVLIGVGIVEEKQPNFYFPTRIGAVFLPKSSYSIEAITEYVLSDTLINAMMNLSYSMKTGKSAFAHITGLSWYEYGQRDPKHLKVMDKAMETYSKLTLPALLKIYPFAEFHLIVDVAGGLGQILTAILLENSEVSGILFDLPITIERASNFIRSAGLNERCQLVTGNMFQLIPSGGDLYIISKVLNDWDDEHVVLILKNIAAAMSLTARLIIIEDIETDNNASLDKAIRDLFLLACAGGKVRNVAQFEELILAGDLKITNVIPVPGQFSIIECMRVKA